MRKPTASPAGPRTSGWCTSPCPPAPKCPGPATWSTVTITEAAAFHLIADPASAEDYSLRRSRAGDAWDRSQADSCGAPPPGGQAGAPGNAGVSLGMPSLPVRGR